MQTSPGKWEVRSAPTHSPREPPSLEWAQNVGEHWEFFSALNHCATVPVKVESPEQKEVCPEEERGCHVSIARKKACPHDVPRERTASNINSMFVVKKICHLDV